MSGDKSGVTSRHNVEQTTSGWLLSHTVSEMEGSYDQR